MIPVAPDSRCCRNVSVQQLKICQDTMTVGGYGPKIQLEFRAQLPEPTPAESRCEEIQLEFHILTTHGNAKMMERPRPVRHTETTRISNILADSNNMKQYETIWNNEICNELQWTLAFSRSLFLPRLLTLIQSSKWLKQVISSVKQQTSCKWSHQEKTTSSYE